MMRFIFVSNRLPYYHNGEWKRASGGLINALEPILIENGGVWLGWDGSTSSTFRTLQANKLSNKTEKYPDTYQIGCIPLSRDEINRYYDAFSNTTLWSLFHYFFEKSAIEKDSWEAYQTVNQRFAAYLSEIATETDVIWIHDYHLMLVPYYLNKIRSELKTHFFLHIPFPHIDIFSILPWGTQFLESLSLCKSIGFHHPGYLQNFKGALEQNQIPYSVSKCFSNPISIDYALFDLTSQKPEVIASTKSFKNLHSGKKIILGVDRIDYSKGIKERILAIEQLLIMHPELKESFVYYQLTVPSRENVESYKLLKKEVDELVGRINGTFSTESWSPVHYHYGTASFQSLVSHYSAADIALVTPLRDGMNLVCKEYVASCSDEDGILILSKFAGAISEMDGCLAVNPYSIDEIYSVLYQAFNMPEQERKQRMKKMRQTLQDHDINRWLKACEKHF